MTVLTGFVIVALISLACNIPLGVWRATTKKFSVGWFVSIHLSAPVIAFSRAAHNLAQWTIPFFLVIAIIGQAAGGSIFRKYIKNRNTEEAAQTL